MYENEFLLTLRYFNTLNPTSDQHLISPYRNTAESLTEIMRIKEMIASLRNKFSLSVPKEIYREDYREYGC